MVLIRTILLVVLYASFWFIPLAFTYLNSPVLGLLFAIVLLGFLIISWLQPDKILLVLLKGKRIWPDSEFTNLFDNKSYRSGISRVDFFSSEFLPSGLMAFQAPFSTPVVILNKASIKDLRLKEVDSLADFIVWSIKSGEAKLNAFVGLLFLPIFVPCLFFSSLKGYFARKNIIFLRDLFAMASLFFYRFNIWVLGKFKFLGMNVEKELQKYGEIDLSELASGFLKIERDPRGLTSSVLAMNTEYYGELFRAITVNFRGRKALR